MLLPPIQAVLLVLVGTYLCYARRSLQLRNRRSWSGITARLQPAALLVTPRARFDHAGVLMEMADYAERNGPDMTVPEQFRSDAITLRLKAMSDRMRFRWGRDTR